MERHGLIYHSIGGYFDYLFSHSHSLNKYNKFLLRSEGYLVTDNDGLFAYRLVQLMPLIPGILIYLKLSKLLTVR